MSKKVFCAYVLALCAVVCVNAQNKVGDYYENGSTKGIVFKVDASGEHGLIVSLDKFSGAWCSDKKKRFETNAFHESDGEKNLESVAKYIEENKVNWSLFPYFEWCRNKGEGWYAPALDELKDLVIAMNGSLGTYNPDELYKFDAIMKSHNGEGILSKTDMPKGGKMPYSMHSSTEGSKGKVYAVGFVATSPFADPKVLFGEIKKSGTIGIGSRAIHKF